MFGLWIAQISGKKGPHGFHGEHETPLTRGRDYTDSNGFHGVGPLRDPSRLTHLPLTTHA